MFAKEYGQIYVVSAVVAFIIGFIAMHNWLEKYVNRTTITPSLYFLIFVGLLLIVGTTIGFRVIRTAKERPADVIKSGT